MSDDEADYYGKRYWLEHQRDDLSLPDVHERVRLDLSERCVDWLGVLLQFRPPPARVLEVGAGHGAFTALLRWAGYDADALDLSRWVADFARERFGIPYLVGAIEQQPLHGGSYDVIVANDVLEHFDDPLATLRRCTELLAPDGIMLVQTPEYPAGRSYAELVGAGDPFLSHVRLPAREHLYLFSRQGVGVLAERLGWAEVSFQEPPYDYDMLFVAGRSTLQRVANGSAELLEASAVGPLVLALADARRSWLGAEQASKAHADHAARLRAESNAPRRGRVPTLRRAVSLVRDRPPAPGGTAK